MRKPPLPPSVLILSIFGMLLALYGIFGSAATVFVLVNRGAVFGPPDPMTAKLHADTAYRVGIGLSVVVGLPLAVLLAASAIGSLWLARWARVGMLVHAVGTIVTAIASTIFTVGYVVPLMTSGVQLAGPQRAGFIFGAYGGGICGGLFTLIYPVCVLIFYTRPKVIDAFNGVVRSRLDDDEYDYDDRRGRRRRDRYDDEDDDDDERFDRYREDDDRYTERRR